MACSSPIKDKYFQEGFSQSLVFTRWISSCSDTNFEETVYKPNTSYPGAFSTFACTLQDVVWSSQAHADLCVPCSCGYHCCFQRLLNLIHSSNYLHRKSSAVVEVTHTIFLVCGFFRFHNNCFRDTTRWECIVESGCVPFCLIELQSFSSSKRKIDRVHRILMHFSTFACKMQDVVWVRSSSKRILMILGHGIHGCKEYRLSVPARILSSRYQS